MAINNREDLKAWLAVQSPATETAFAARCALRALPGLGHAPAPSRNGLILLALRGSLGLVVLAYDSTSASGGRDKLLDTAATLADRLDTRALNISLGGGGLSDKNEARVLSMCIRCIAFCAAAPTPVAVKSTENAVLRGADALSVFEEGADPFDPDAPDAEALFAAVSLDSNHSDMPPEDMLRRRLWSATSDTAQEPLASRRGYDQLSAFFDSDPEVWGFWKRWLEGMRNGQPMDWTLQEQVALIPEAVWAAGPEAVAEAISKIEADFAGEVEPLDQDRLLRHVEGLLRHPDLAADAAESMALQVEGSIADYKREAPANALPKGFESLERLPVVFRGISTTIRISGGTDDSTAKLVAEINRLHAVIAGLERDLAKAHHALSDARLSKLEAAQQRTLGEKTQTWLTNITLIGSLGLNMAWFMGLEREDLRYPALKAQIEQRIEQMKAAESSEDDDELPSTTEL